MYLYAFVVTLFLGVSLKGVSNIRVPIKEKDDYYSYEEYEDYQETAEATANEMEVQYVMDAISVGRRTGLTDHGCPKCSCGMANQLTRIVGGWMTEVNEYPWMVALTRKNQIFCGGTLINDQYVLTAAHCVLRPDNTTGWVRGTVFIVLSEHNTATASETMTETRKVSKVTVHPGFSRSNFDHDLALLKLDRKVEFRHGIRSACLPPSNGDYSGEWGTVAGWGVTREGGKVSPFLRQTSVPILSNQQCQRRGYKPWKITDNMLCAGDFNMMDSCQGDSGGPLLFTNRYNQMLEIGVVSWGEGCARERRPGVYARVDRHIDWILDNTREACYCY